jgi:CelD/BcsL family acetyltransferase involved in cellulose biosynthesis
VTQRRAGEAAFVETPDLHDLTRFEAAWRDLAARAAEPNVFAESDFLLPALARLAPAGRVTTLMIWNGATREKLIGVAAILPPRLPLLGLSRVWLGEQAALPAMLIDRDATETAVSAVLAWVASGRLRAAGLLIPTLAPGGPIGAALAAIAAREGRRIASFAERQRASLPAGRAAGFEASLDKKRRKEWARQRRRLAERGRLESRALEGTSGIEAFLALEGRGWKGERGSALAASAGLAAFTREMLARFAMRGDLRIQALILDGEPIAVGLALRSGARAFYWKTTYDERYAGHSPGVLMSIDFSSRLERETGLTLIDSCALPGHPMIDRLWLGRLDLVDFAAACSPGFTLALAAIRAERRLRASVKRVVIAVLNRRGS